MKSLFLLAWASLLAGCGNGPAPAAQAPHAPLSFTAAQATNALARTAAFVSACTPRDAGTPGAARAAGWLRDQLVENGVSASVDTFTNDTPRGLRTFSNVVATFPGTSDQWIVLLSHFDTKSGVSEGFQGANDGGSSTGLLLELAVQFQRCAPLKYGVLCAFLDGEECSLGYSERDGFHGSRRLAHALKQKRTKIKAAILMDMIGDRDLRITMPRNSTGELRALALEAADATGDRAKIGLFDGDIFDDHQAFLECGYPAVDLIDFDYGSAPGVNDYWHTAKDTTDKLSADSLLTTGRIVLEMLNRL